MELQDKLRCFRIENGISQLEAAEKLEVSRQTVYRWETGTSLPSMDNLMRLSKLYNVPLNVWTDDDWTPNPLHQPPELETSILEPAIPEPEPAIPELTAQERAGPKPRKYLRRPAFGAIILTAALMAGIGYVMVKKLFPHPLAMWTLTAILGGGLGNLIDRVRLGYVVDMFNFQFMSYPVFNVADCYAVAACFLFGYLILFFYKEEELEWFALFKSK